MHRIQREAEHFNSLYISPYGSKHLIELQEKENENFENKAAVIYETIPNVRNARVLEVGGGQGNLTRHISRFMNNLTVADISLASLLHLHSVILNNNLARTPVEHMCFKSEYFDAVVGSGILHHTNIDLSLSEINRVLLSRGLCIFFEPNLYFIENYLLNKVTFLRKLSTMSEDEQHFTKTFIIKKLQKHNFIDIYVELFFSYHPRLPKVALSLNKSLNKVFQRLKLRYACRELLIVARKA